MSSASETIYIGVKDEETALQQPRGSIAPHLLILVVQIAALVGPRFRGRQEVTCITIVALSVLCHFNQFTNDIGLANLFALAWPHYLLTLANFLFTSADGPEADLWRVDRKPREAMSFPAFSLRKIKWALATLINLRGIRWNYEVRNVPKRVRSWEREGKVRFLLLQLVDLAWMVLMADLLSQLGLRFFFTDSVTGKLYTNSKYLSIRSSDLLWSLAKSFVYGAGPYFFINMQYIVCSILAVSIGLSKPEDWPPLFGKLSGATTIRNFWGSFWHQMIRKGLTSFSTATAASLGLKKGSNMYSYTHLWVAFAISGVMHAGSMVMLPPPLNITVRERTLGIFLFFIYQAAAITLEDFVQWVWRHVAERKPSAWKTLVGYIWVVCSFWFCLSLAGDVMLRLRMGQSPPLPFSVFKQLVQQISIR